MKYLTSLFVLLLIAYPATADDANEELQAEVAAARAEMQAARGEIEVAREELDQARAELDISISEQLEEARHALDEAAERLAELHIKDLDGLAPLVQMEALRELDFADHARLGVLVGKGIDQGGVVLVGVTPGSGAQKAGLKAGDIIVEVRGIPLDKVSGEEAVAQFIASLDDLEDGTKVELQYKRDSELIQTEVTASSSKQNMWAMIGRLGNVSIPGDFDFDFDIDFDGDKFNVMDIGEVMGHYFGVEKGVLVIEDDREEDGFLPGDIIKAVEGEDVDSADDAIEKLSREDPDEYQVKVLRKGRHKTIKVASIQGIAPHHGFVWNSDGDQKRKVIVERVKSAPPVKKVIRIKQESDSE